MIKREKIGAALQKIEQNMKDGWSAQVSVKMACGSPANNLAKAVRLEPRYLEILNNYMGNHLSSFKFELRNEKVVPKKGPYGKRVSE